MDQNDIVVPRKVRSALYIILIIGSPIVGYLAVSQPLDSHGDLAAVRVYGYGASVRTGAAPGAPRGPPSSHP